MFLLGLGFRPGIFLASAGELSQERAIATDVSAGEAQHLEAFSRRVLQTHLTKTAKCS